MTQKRYFGTDGVRGRMGEAPITPELVLKLGYAAGRVLVREATFRAGNDRLQRCPAGQLVDPDGLAERVGLSAKELVVQAVDDPREALSRVQNRTGDRRADQEPAFDHWVDRSICRARPGKSCHQFYFPGDAG